MKLEQFIELAEQGKCSHQLFGGMMKDRTDYQPCLTDCSGKDLKCLGYNSLDCMPLLKTYFLYNKFEEETKK